MKSQRSKVIRQRRSEKKKRGRPKAQPKKRTIEQQIKNLASLGLTNIEIAQYFGYHEATLRRNFDEFLTKGRIELKKSLRKKQIDVAKKGNVSMLIWLGKQYLGQSDKIKEDSNLNINVRLTRWDEALTKNILKNVPPEADKLCK